MANFCTICGKPVGPEARFCPSCGGTLEGVTAPNPASPNPAPPTTGTSKWISVDGKSGSKTKFQWKWAFASAGFTFALVWILGFGFGLIIGTVQPEFFKAQQAIIIVALGVSLVAYFLGAMLAAFLSPGQTIKEPAVGVAMAVIVTNLISGEIGGILFSWAIPFCVGLLGAKTGEYIQEKRSNR